MLSCVLDHPWDISPSEAIVLQQELANKHLICDMPDPVEYVAGVDVGIKGDLVRAAVVVLTYPGLELVEQVVADRPLTFPYVPGLLSFREAPVILAALGDLAFTPDVSLFDGQGYAHPRRMGLATHVGILLDRPTVGCAKSRLCGQEEAPAEERGSFTLLMDRDETIGAVVRTRTKVKPLYISVGHRVRLSQAIELVLGCGGGYRLPEPTRWAHRVASQGVAARPRARS